MTIYGFRSSTYARNIVYYGTARLTARDGFKGVAEGYYTPTEQYAANNYDLETLDNALAMTWVTQVEYDEIVALMPVVTTP